MEEITKYRQRKKISQVFEVISWVLVFYLIMQII